MSGLAVPVANASIPLQGHFAPRHLVQDYPYFHRGTLDAAFAPYFGAILEQFHAGTDFDAPRGTPIHASEAGTVVYADWAPAFGTFAGGGHVVDVLIDGGMHFVSNHCDTLNVSTGQKVTRGQQVATVGDTGNAAGVHDHFALYTDNPLRLHNAEDYLAGGRLANSVLILPTQLPDTSTEDYPVWFDHLKPASGTIVFRVGTHIYDSPGHAVQTVSSASSAPRIASLLNSDGTKYAAYILGTGGVRLVKLSEVTIK